MFQIGNPVDGAVICEVRREWFARLLCWILRDRRTTYPLRIHVDYWHEDDVPEWELGGHSG